MKRFSTSKKRLTGAGGEGDRCDASKQNKGRAATLSAMTRLVLDKQRRNRKPQVHSKMSAAMEGSQLLKEENNGY